MIDLIARPPDGWQVFEPMGYPPSIEFYFGVEPHALVKLPLDAHFGVVYSPNVYVDPASPLHPWHYVVYEVCLYQYRPDRGLEPSYKAIGKSRHTLSRYERQHFEELWTAIVLNGKRLAG